MVTVSVGTYVNKTVLLIICHDRDSNANISLRNEAIRLLTATTAEIALSIEIHILSLPFSINCVIHV